MVQLSDTETPPNMEKRELRRPNIKDQSNLVHDRTRVKHPSRHPRDPRETRKRREPLGEERRGSHRSYVDHHRRREPVRDDDARDGHGLGHGHPEDPPRLREKPPIPRDPARERPSSVTSHMSMSSRHGDRHGKMNLI